MKERDKQSLIESANKKLNKAERFFEIENYNKAAKHFIKAGEDFYKVGEYDAAEKIFLMVSKSYEYSQEYENILTYYRKAANASLMIDEFNKAGRNFQLAAKYALKREKSKDRDFNALVCSSFSYFCYFLLGRQDEGLKYIKSIKVKVDMDSFRENIFTQLIKNTTTAIIEKNIKSLKEIENNLEEYKFKSGEVRLIKFVLLLAYINLSIKNQLNFQKNNFTTDEKIDCSLDIDTKLLLNLTEDKGLNFEIKKLTFNNIRIAHSDNLSIIRKPKLPIELNKGEHINLKFKAVSNFPDPESSFGPILISSNINDFLTFHIKSKSQHLNISSPPTQLGVYFKNLKPPLINQTFPLEITVSNKSTGEALEIEIELEFPEELKVIRGTTKKQVYSIRPNEDIRWEIQIKPLEPGEFEINTTVKYKDSDNNIIGPKSKAYPMKIKL